MNIRVQTLRTVFAVSVLLTAFWVIGFVWEPVAGRDAPIPLLVVIGALVATGVSFVTFRGGRLALPMQLQFTELARLFIPRMVGAYLVSVPIVGAVVWLLIRAFSSTPSDSEVGVIVPLMALWLPLWFAPAVGAEWVWRSMRKRGMA